MFESTQSLVLVLDRNASSRGICIFHRSVWVLEFQQHGSLSQIRQNSRI